MENFYKQWQVCGMKTSETEAKFVGQGKPLQLMLNGYCSAEVQVGNDLITIRNCEKRKIFISLEWSE